MKVEELQTLIKDKDLKNLDVQQEIVDAINNDINSVVKRKKESIAEELADYKAKIAENNLNSKKLESTIKELNDKISEQEAFSGKLKTKLYISGKSKTNLDDQAMEDVITLAAKRVSKDKTNEQAIDEVLNLYFNNAAPKVVEAKPLPKSVPSPRNFTNVLQANQDGQNLNVIENALNDIKSTFGIGSFAKKKN